MSRPFLRRSFSWISLVLVLLHALAPGLGHASVAPTPAAVWQDLCSASLVPHGLADSVGATADRDGAPAEPGSLHHLLDCLHCCVHASVATLPSSAAASWTAVAADPAAPLPATASAAPCHADPAELIASPRAPPPALG